MKIAPLESFNTATPSGFKDFDVNFPLNGSRTQNSRIAVFPLERSLSVQVLRCFERACKGVGVVVSEMGAIRARLRLLNRSLLMRPCLHLGPCRMLPWNTHTN